MGQDTNEAARAWPRWLLGSIGAYFLAHFVFRIAITGTLESDEGEQALWAQWLLWGYGAQPPLYTWLQAGAFSLIGVGVPALALVKNGLLFTTYACILQAGRRLLPDPRLTTLAAASLLMLPQVAWESQRDLTHSVLVTTLAAAAFLATLRIREHPSLARYLIWGLLLGAGLLSKYNFLLFLGALLPALAVHPEGRRLLMNRKAAAGLALTVAVAAPHYVWAWLHWEAATGSAHKLGLADRGRLQGLASLAVNAVLFLLPFLVLGGLWFRSCLSRRPGSQTPDRLLRHFVLAVFGVTAAMILVLGIGDFKDRWLQPLLVFVPLLFMAHVDARSPAFPKAARRHLASAAFLALVVLSLIPLRVVLGPSWGYTTPFNLPYQQLQESIRSRGSPGAVITRGNVTAGNLRVQFPEVHAYALNTSVRPPRVPASGDVVVVWSDAHPQEGIPDGLRKWVRARLGVDPATYPVRYLELTYQYSSQPAPDFGVIRLLRETLKGA